MMRGVLLAAVFVSVAARGVDYAAEAEEAAKEAWKHAKDLAKSSKDTAKIAEEVKAAGKGAKKAMEKAKEMDQKMTELYEATKAATKSAASEEAMAYFQEIKAAGAQAAAEAAMPRSEATLAKAAAEAAADAAAEPYRTARVKAEQRAMEYQTQAQAMYAKGNQMQVDGAGLAPHAAGYQNLGQTIEATRILSKARTLVEQGLKYKRQAKIIHDAAQQINAARPAYAQAEQAARLHAAAMATPAVLPTNAPPL